MTFQDRPCNEYFKAKKSASWLSVYGPRLESTGYHHAIAEAQGIAGDTHGLLLAVACRQIFVSRFQAGAIQYPGFSLKIDYE